ncbi:hypothetical protein [Micromonospora echinofusca]|uniref:Uncharacterized protein n=1 Tax=Micromonospora echinofusca TaxID=47858 RepID=A0ABS3VJZ1_MICEH|nr:hypothetical protein [Micromonospora echinofusca]MBO4204845.1 hypothetical protein [Micromonospora echinofusca]
MPPLRARSLRATTRRWTTLTLSTALAATTMLTVQPAPASADSCPSGMDWDLLHWSSSGSRTYRAYIFEDISSVPTFNVSDSRVAVNNLDSPISVTFTSSKSQTFTLTASTSMKGTLFEVLEASVDTSITMSRTTQIGVSVTATVPAHSTVQGDYGVRAYDVTFRAITVIKYDSPFLSRPACDYSGPETHTVNAPTTVEGWRVRQL